ncbi:MAG: RNA methyltransferase [Muribaculaceae bacterium]|nr:RNA methyltransferase [Roseburia sp.]MCM1431468.1 RNA methyltransferase [Muribaculaceae bacterium]MCM1493238.1 RNA methyltransferase [Muribaculaceae bacterium]
MITSTGNPQIKNLAALMKKPRERRLQGAFVAEGERLCLEAPEELLMQLFVSESYLAVPGHKAALGGRRYEAVSDRVFASVSDTQTPQGILAVVRMPEYGQKELLCGARTHLLVLESIQDPGNLGTMFRTGEGAGITGVIMNASTVDLFNPKVVRATMGSIYRLPYRIVEDLPAELAALQREGVHLYAAHLDGAVRYDLPDYTGPCGFLIGNEGSGLTEETASLAEKIKIPMEGQVESLNAAIAATLMMYECSRQRRNRSSAYENMV